VNVQLSSPTAIVLDTSPLSLLTQKQGHAQGDACKIWYANLELAGHQFFVPEIADYELRRELLRTGKSTSIARLDKFNSVEPNRYLPLSTADVRLAADLWSQARNSGRTGAPPDALDGDVFIAAQALRLVAATHGLSQTIVATSNVSHLTHLVKAELWSDLVP